MTGALELLSAATDTMSTSDMVSACERLFGRLEHSHMSVQRCMRQASEFASQAVVSRLQEELRRCVAKDDRPVLLCADTSNVSFRAWNWLGSVLLDVHIELVAGRLEVDKLRAMLRGDDASTVNRFMYRKPMRRKVPCRVKQATSRNGAPARSLRSWHRGIRQVCSKLNIKRTNVVKGSHLYDKVKALVEEMKGSSDDV